MNKRIKPAFLLIAGLTALTVYLVYAAFMVNRHATVDRFSMDEVSAVSDISLQKNDGVVNLRKRENGFWIVNEQYHADRVAIDELLSFLRNAAVRRPVPVALKEQIGREIDSLGTQVEVYKRTYWINLPGGLGLIPRKKRIHGFIAGNDSPDGESVYMRLHRSSDPYEIYIPGTTAPLGRRFTAKENKWRDPVVMNLSPGQLKTVEVVSDHSPDESFLLQRDAAGGIRLFRHDGREIPPERINQHRLTNYLRMFTSLFYETLLSDEELSELDKWLFRDPFMGIKVTDTSGHEQLLRCYYLDVGHAETLLPVYAKVDPNRFVLQLDENEYAMALFLVFNRIIRPLSFFTLHGNRAEESGKIK